MRKNWGKFSNYMRENPGVLTTLLEGYTDVDISLLCGAMFRECMKEVPPAPAESGCGACLVWWVHGLCV